MAIIYPVFVFNHLYFIVKFYFHASSAWNKREGRDVRYYFKIIQLYNQGNWGSFSSGDSTCSHKIRDESKTTTHVSGTSAFSYTERIFIFVSRLFPRIIRPSIAFISFFHDCFIPVIKDKDNLTLMLTKK